MSREGALSMLVATGLQAEAVVRATAEQLAADWERYKEEALDLSDLDAARLAIAKMEAIGHVSALLEATVKVWDEGDDTNPDVVKIGSVS